MSTLKVNNLDTESGTTVTVAAGKTIAGTNIRDTAQIASGAVGTTELDSSLDLSGKTLTLPATLPATAGTNITGLPGANITGTIPAAALGNVDLTGLQDDIALLGFKTQANGSLAKYSLVDQTVDSFEDATGVDAGASTGLYRSSVGKYYSGATGPDVTGGTITIDGNFTIHTFLANGNYITDTAQTLDYLIVAGGGGGGGDNSGGVDSAGGGGAGGYRHLTGVALPAGTFAAVIGDGGNGKIGHGDGDKGSQSSFNSATSEGGGYGAGSNNCAGTGGSVLIIGSAAGVAVMGILKIDFKV